MAEMEFGDGIEKPLIMPPVEGEFSYPEQDDGLMVSSWFTISWLAARGWSVQDDTWRHPSYTEAADAFVMAGVTDIKHGLTLRQALEMMMVVDIVKADEEGPDDIIHRVVGGLE